MAIPGAGKVHSELLQELQDEMRKIRVKTEKVKEDEWARVYGKIDAVLLAPDISSLVAAKEVAQKDIHSFTIGLWTSKKALGPETPERLIKEAKGKESFARFAKDRGGDKNKAKAEKSLAEAAALRQRASELEELRRKPPEVPAVRWTQPVQQNVVQPLRADGKRRRLLIVDVSEEPSGS